MFFSLLAGLGGFLGNWQLNRSAFKRSLLQHQETFSSDLFELEKNTPIVCVERADLKKAYYVVIREKVTQEKYFLELGVGQLVDSDLKDILLFEPQNFTSWHIQSNPFLPVMILESSRPELLLVSQLSALKDHPMFAIVNKKKLFFLNEVPARLQSLPHSLSCPPERHQAYAAQWFLLGIIALFFSLKDTYFFIKKPIVMQG